MANKIRAFVILALTVLGVLALETAETYDDYLKDVKVADLQQLLSIENSYTFV